MIAQLCIYVSVIRILAKGYLPNTLLTPKRLQGILSEVKRSLHITNPDYTLVLDRLHLYYDMQLVTFGIDRDMNIVIQFPVFIQPYTQKPLILYQLETVPVLILDKNIEAQSYTHLRVNKPYLALNSETYISLRHQELISCKKIGYEFYCEELFIVKHKSSYSCESAIYFNLMLCKAVLVNCSIMSRGKFTVYVFGNPLQYTTACLQVLFSSQLLGRMTKN